MCYNVSSTYLLHTCAIGRISTYEKGSHLTYLLQFVDGADCSFGMGITKRIEDMFAGSNRMRLYTGIVFLPSKNVYVYSIHVMLVHVI